MNNCWSQMCRGVSNLKVEGDTIIVAFADERHHQVHVLETDHTLELTAVVARARHLESAGDFPIRAWLRNRATQLVGFRIDKQGRLLGEAWIPKTGLTAEDLIFSVRRIAFECDRFEYHLTGKDQE